MNKLPNNGYNESLFPGGRCYICGTGGDLVRHEIFHGSRRTASKKYGCWVTLCPSCHRDIHSRPASYRWLKEEAQKLAMFEHKLSAEEFRQIFGKNYL